MRVESGVHLAVCGHWTRVCASGLEPARVCACARVCVVGEAESQVRLPVSAGPPPPSHLTLAPSWQLPCLQTLSLPLRGLLGCPPRERLQPRPDRVSPSPWPPHLPQAPAAAAEVLSGGEGGCGRTPKDPFHLNSIQRPEDMGTCPRQSQWASWSRGLWERIR